MAKSSNPVGIGIIGAGYISTTYLENCTTRFENLRVIGIADAMMDRAESQALKFGIDALTVDALLAHPDIDLVVNLTIPAAHGDVALQAIDAGKSVYNEKPLATTREAAREILDQAAGKGVLVGSAPDTFLGGGFQTARAILDSGVIGNPVAATGTLLLSGHERWHPNPDFYYQPGGGPLFDMGPYYLAAMISLMGPVERVASTTSASYPTRTIATGDRAGETIPVDTPTHIITVLDFAGGPRASLTTSFDVYDTDRSTMVLYGTEGTIRLPDPNTFGGPVELLRAGSDTWETIELLYGPIDNARGLGVSDLARSLRDGRPARASGEMGYHIVDVMHAALESSDSGKHISITSTCERPAPLHATGEKLHLEGLER